ncbi:MAG: YraN family protein [Eubacterium ramulus]
MNTHELGTTQEQRVADWMQQRGFYIVEKNFRCKFGEIDLIAKKDGYLIFVEVKYRSNEQYGAPREAVDWRKRQRISNAAVFYLKRYGYSMEHPCRFDVAEVSQDSIYLMENAFDYWVRFADWVCGSIEWYRIFLTKLKLYQTSHLLKWILR